MNVEEQLYLDIGRSLVEKYERMGSRGVRDGHSRTSLFGKQLRFNLSNGFPLLTHKKVFLRGVFEELKWMLNGQTHNKYLEEKNVYIWSQWNDALLSRGYESGELGAIYGESWRKFGARDSHYQEGVKIGGFDQIEWVINEIKTNPTSSRLIVNAWNPKVHCENGKAALPPCHTMFQFFVEDLSYQDRLILANERNEEESWFQGSSKFLRLGDQKIVEELMDDKGIPKSKLSCQLYQRSSDFYVGGPFNIAGYALLTHMVAQQCNMDVGDFVWTIGDCHIYGNQYESVKDIHNLPTFNFPKIKIRKAKDIYSYEWSDITIEGYESGEKIHIPVST